jgi:hypothetical protein
MMSSKDLEGDGRCTIPEFTAETEENRNSTKIEGKKNLKPTEKTGSRRGSRITRLEACN